MSKIADLAYDIEQLYIDGLSARAIAEQLSCPIGVVKGWIEGNGCESIDPAEWDEAFGLWEVPDELAQKVQEAEYDPFSTVNS